MPGAPKSIDAAKRGGGDYRVLTLGVNKRYGPWPPTMPSGRVMQKRKQHEAALVLWSLIDDFDGRVYSKAGDALSLLLEAINAHVPTTDDQMNINSLRTTLYDLISIGLVTRDGWSKGTRLLKVDAKKSQLPMPRPYKLERAERESVSEPDEVDGAVEAPDSSDYLTARLIAEAEVREEEPLHEEVVDLDLPQGFDYDAFATSLVDVVIRKATTRPEDPDVEPSYLYVERNHYRDLANKRAERIRALEHEVERKENRLASLRVDLGEERRLREQLEATAQDLIRQMQERRAGEIFDEDTKLSLARIMSTVPGFERREKEFASNGNGGR